jgi:RNA polymerase sigma-70 factor (ECF subfamily)
MEYRTADESILVRNLSNGNILAFNTLYREYSKRLYNFSFSYLRSQVESEELVQEVFTIIWEKRRHLKAELSFKSFLFTIAFNIIRKHFRARKYLAEYLKKYPLQEIDQQTSEKIMFDFLSQHVYSLADKLSDRRKEIFIKSRLEGLSIKEISESLKLSHKTVENQLSDALKFIRTNLDDEQS